MYEPHTATGLHRELTDVPIPDVRLDDNLKGLLDPGNLKQTLFDCVRFDTHFPKTWKHHFTSNDLTL